LVISETIRAFLFISFYFKEIFHFTGRIDCHLAFDSITVNGKTIVLVEDSRIFNLDYYLKRNTYIIIIKFCTF